MTRERVDFCLAFPNRAQLAELALKARLPMLVCQGSRRDHSDDVRPPTMIQ
jgi:hypothetical protein